MDLFEASAAQSHEPLAARMRPRTLDEFVGQDHIVGKGRLLRRAIQADQLSSIILYGPPGTGKTTLARIIAKTTRSNFLTLNAVLCGVKDVREAIETAKKFRNLYDRKTILFVDEVHRWNKAQQDALLPWVENGTFVLIGATTENPFFEVNSALVSRSRIFQLVSLTDADLMQVAKQALAHPERGYGKWVVTFEEDALEHIVEVASGDARSLLNALQLAVETTPDTFPPPKGAKIFISMETAEQSIQQKAVLYDKEGDYHFDVISAFIKSIRGSDADAALYWLAVMIKAGEDPKFIFRRMLISASEDIGMADPQALVIVEAAAAAFDRVGMPEGRFHLAQSALYLATAKKSNTTLALFDAIRSLANEKQGDVPSHLKDGSRDKEGFGHGKGYLYPHAYKDHWVAQQYLPDQLQGRLFYTPSDQGYEAGLRDDIIRKREVQLGAMLETMKNSSDAPGETLTYTPSGKNRDRWLSRISSGKGDILEIYRKYLFADLQFLRHHRILLINENNGSLLWEACRKVPEGHVVVHTGNSESKKTYETLASRMDRMEQPKIIDSTLEAFFSEHLETLISDNPFDLIIGRDCFTRLNDRKRGARKLYDAAAPGGYVSLAQVIPAKGQRLSAFISSEDLPEGLYDRYITAEESVYQGDDPLMNWDEEGLAVDLEEAGFILQNRKSKEFFENRIISEDNLSSWFENPSPGSYGAVLRQELETEDIALIRKKIAQKIIKSQIQWKSFVFFIILKREVSSD